MQICNTTWSSYPKIASVCPWF